MLNPQVGSTNLITSCLPSVELYQSIYIVIFSPPAAPSKLKPEMTSIVWEAETPFQCSFKESLF
jgi:hypothetical protein